MEGSLCALDETVSGFQESCLEETLVIFGGGVEQKLPFSPQSLEIMNSVHSLEFEPWTKCGMERHILVFSIQGNF